MVGTLAFDLRFEPPKPRPLKREFIELIWSSPEKDV